MTAYTAIFSRGETKSIANSTRDYRAAWLIEVHDTTGEAADFILMGFAATFAMAEKAAQREFAGLNVTRWGKQRPPRWILNRSEVIALAKQEG